MLFIFLILASIVLAQPSPPAQGIQTGYESGLDIRFPLAVTQCEPVFIYYNTTISLQATVTLVTPETGALFGLLIPGGVGYIEWVCNIPAGYDFGVLSSYGFYYYIVVQHGPLSSCLHNVTTTYQYAWYFTTNLAAYTARPPTPHPRRIQ